MVNRDTLWWVNPLVAVFIDTCEASFVNDPSLTIEVGTARRVIRNAP
jgi:hypothetical protein